MGSKKWRRHKWWYGRKEKIYTEWHLMCKWRSWPLGTFCKDVDSNPNESWGHEHRPLWLRRSRGRPVEVLKVVLFLWNRKLCICWVKMGNTWANDFIPQNMPLTTYSVFSTIYDSKLANYILSFIYCFFLLSHSLFFTSVKWR